MVVAVGAAAVVVVVAVVVVLAVPVLEAALVVRAARVLVEVPVLPAIEVVPVVVAQASPRHMVVEGTVQINLQINSLPPVLLAITRATLHLLLVPVVDYPPHTPGTPIPDRADLSRRRPSHPLTQNALRK